MNGVDNDSVIGTSPFATFKLAELGKAWVMSVSLLGQNKISAGGNLRKIRPSVSGVLISDSRGSSMISSIVPLVPLATSASVATFDITIAFIPMASSIWSRSPPEDFSFSSAI